MKSSNELRKIFLRFFEKEGHKVVPSSSLLPNDPSVLFTTAGMQQFKEYYLQKPSPYGKNVASCQKCFRTSDIEEVGKTPRHLTFFEMLGNFSFGGYFKERAIELAFKFLFEELKLQKEKILFTVFGGDNEIPEDKESFKIWQDFGIEKEKIFKMGREDNFWGPTGKEGPCGPTTEIYFCPTGRLEEGIELWNLVFNEYYQTEDKKLTPLKQKGVDTGMGLERLALAVQGKNSVFETDLFLPLVKEILSFSKENLPAVYIIVDHIKAGTFLIGDGVLPSNVEQGYVLRRLLRRAITFGNLFKIKEDFLINLAKKTIQIYQDVYPELKRQETDILVVLEKERERFEKTLKEGLEKFEREIKNYYSQGLKVIPGKIVFDLYQSYGFPFELTKELAKKEGLEVDEEDFKEKFKEHQEISRAGAEKKFGGIGVQAGYEATKLHTATHLLHSALRKILGESVRQMGSDITSERLRFDFSFPRKLTPEELKKVEDLVNQKIKENLKVERLEMPLKEALKIGALAFFKEKYPEIVSVYKIGDFSLEICAGPHVKETGELGNFKIVKEESAGAGVRRIRAILK